MVADANVLRDDLLQRVAKFNLEKSNLIDLHKEEKKVEEKKAKEAAKEKAAAKAVEKKAKEGGTKRAAEKDDDFEQPLKTYMSKKIKIVLKKPVKKN